MIIFFYRYNTWDRIKEKRNLNKTEGLNTIRQQQLYKLIQVEKKFLFTRFYVYYNQTEILNTL